jgi:enterochelin esterase-like enzyme
MFSNQASGRDALGVSMGSLFAPKATIYFPNDIGFLYQLSPNFYTTIQYDTQQCWNGRTTLVRGPSAYEAK